MRYYYRLKGKKVWSECSFIVYGIVSKSRFYETGVCNDGSSF